MYTNTNLLNNFNENIVGIVSVKVELKCRYVYVYCIKCVNLLRLFI